MNSGNLTPYRYSGKNELNSGRQSGPQIKESASTEKLEALARAFKRSMDKTGVLIEQNYDGNKIKIEFGEEDLVTGQLSTQDLVLNSTQFASAGSNKVFIEKGSFNFDLFLRFVNSIKVNMRGTGNKAAATVVFNDSFWQGSKVTIKQVGQTLYINWEAANLQI